MAWNIFVSPDPIMSRRRFVSSALLYGLSLTVRFTSPVGAEAEIPPQVDRSANPMAAIMVSDATPIPGDLSLQVQPVAFHFGWPVGATGCRALCERQAPMPRCLTSR
jgi:hypothetical protein